jgi:hypothetical protein
LIIPVIFQSVLRTLSHSLAASYFPARGPWSTCHADLFDYRPDFIGVAAKVDDDAGAGGFVPAPQT